ncbi:MAG: transcriptional regulator [Rhodocyclaceae bacterium]|nr:transcriptional regulator [Rhodocyclaceae bacterium]MBR4876992.1 transcriptional regulator [Rhodocyclaceae bacterium]
MEISLIRTRKEYDAAMRRLHQLLDVDPAEGSPESDEIELLSLVIGQYEDERCPKREDTFDAVEFILYVMEERGLSRKDMEAYIGGSGRVSEVLSRRRPLTLAMIRRLHDGLGIPADILIRPPRPAAQTEKCASRRPAARNSKDHAASAHA